MGGLPIMKHTILPLLKVAKKHGANDIVVFTNFELIYNQMKGIYEVRKDNLKLLHREARIVVAQFHSFTITYHVDIKRLFNDLLFGAVSTIGGGVKNDLVSTSTPTKFIHGHRYRSPMCGFFLVMIVVVSFMGWLVHWWRMEKFIHVDYSLCKVLCVCCE
jgi:hypothetical protein